MCYEPPKDVTPKEFRQIMRARMSETKRRAEKKRLDGLRHIADMNSRHGIHPVQELFPQEIWVKIMGDSDWSPRDLQNMSQVHPAFQDILECTKIQDVLLPLIINYDLPFLDRFLNSEEDLMILRRVSRSLRDSVDRLIESDLLTSMRNLSRLPRFDPICLCWEEFEEFEVIKKMLIYSSESNTRPEQYVIRSINIMLHSEVNDENQQNFHQIFQSFKEKIFQLLRKIGDQILYFRLSIIDMEKMHNLGVSTLDMYNFARYLLKRMPNLRWLNLSTDGDYGVRLMNISMPTLNALERVDLDLASHSLDPIVTLVLTANPHVKYIKNNTVGKQPNQPFRYINTSHYTSPEILQLELKSLDYEYSTCRWRCLVESDVCWDLREMKLSMGEVLLYDLLQYLGMWFSNLEVLTLDISSIVIRNNLNYLNLPNLKHLELRFDCYSENFDGAFHFFFSLHFLLYCEKLESLTWFNQMKDRDVKNIRRKENKGYWPLPTSDRMPELIGFRGDKEVAKWNLSGSNIWDLFPHLKVIRAKSREGDKINYFRDEGYTFFYRDQYHTKRLILDKMGKLVNQCVIA